MCLTLFSVSVESLTCNRCSFGLLGFCVSSSTVDCSTNTSQCFTGKASRSTSVSVSLTVHLSVTRAEPVSPPPLCSVCVHLVLGGLQHARLHRGGQLQRDHQRHPAGCELPGQSGMLLHGQMQPGPDERSPARQGDERRGHHGRRPGLGVGKPAVTRPMASCRIFVASWTSTKR